MSQSAKQIATTFTFIKSSCRNIETRIKCLILKLKYVIQIPKAAIDDLHGFMVEGNAKMVTATINSSEWSKLFILSAGECQCGLAIQYKTVHLLLLTPQKTRLQHNS